MNERILRPAHIAAAAGVLGGILILALPWYGMSVARLVIASIGAAAAIWALVVASPPAWWRSPFEAGERPARRITGPDELNRLRVSMSGRRHPLAGGPPLPAATIRLLQPLVHAALEREDIDAADDSAIEDAGDRLSPVTLAVLACPPPQPLPWYRTLRPDARGTAAVVHAVLDDIDRLTFADAGTGAVEPGLPPAKPPRDRLDIRSSRDRHP